MKRNNKITIAAAITSMLLVASLASCASVEREFKSLNSELNGGLNRTLTVYDYNGKEIRTYEGKMDIEVSPSNDKVLFDLDGKRNIIRGGIVIIEEK